MIDRLAAGGKGVILYKDGSVPVVMQDTFSILPSGCSFSLTAAPITSVGGRYKTAPKVLDYNERKTDFSCR